ncbi:hypothetical protein NOZE110980_13850 [Nocardioides zeicaulis]
MTVETSASPRVPAVRHPVPPTPQPAVRILHLEVHPVVQDVRLQALVREAAARYEGHGTHLLGDVPRPGPTAQAAAPGTADGWTVVGRWLAFVAVVTLLAVALALVGHTR